MYLNILNVLVFDVHKTKIFENIAYTKLLKNCQYHVLLKLDAQYILNLNIKYRYYYLNIVF